MSKVRFLIRKNRKERWFWKLADADKGFVIAEGKRTFNTPRDCRKDINRMKCRIPFASIKTSGEL